jgi:hypothetical protein
MRLTRIAFIGRAERFSPNSADKDAAILTEVNRHLLLRGYRCYDIWQEDDGSARANWTEEADVYVSMGRQQDTLNWLSDRERHGKVVVNSTASVSMCNKRKALMERMETAGIPVPPRTGSDGYWVKRGCGSSETAQDVVFADNYEEACRRQEEMAARGIATTDVRAHVRGDLIKCYGICGTEFFRCYYPGEDGEWKFGDERRNGRPQHYGYNAAELQATIEKAAELTGLTVYGADCIIKQDGQPVLIDLNDWPSFSRCRKEAARAIADEIGRMIEK